MKAASGSETARRGVRVCLDRCLDLDTTAGRCRNSPNRTAARSRFAGPARAAAAGGLPRPIAPHAGRLPCERRRACLPPLREPGALPSVGSGLVGGGTPSDHDSGGGQARHSVSAEAGADTAWSTLGSTYRGPCVGLEDLRNPVDMWLAVGGRLNKMRRRPGRHYVLAHDDRNMKRPLVRIGHRCHQLVRASASYRGVSPKVCSPHSVNLPVLALGVA